jgi:predicted MFS family arabinose efflux permease
VIATTFRRALLGLQLGILVVGVAVAFADSSIVVLALPELLRQSDATIVGVSLVITIYNATLALTAFALVLWRRRWTPQRLARIGLVVFALASAACAAAPNLTALVVARGAQGVGGALLLTGAFAVVRSLAPTRGLALLAGAGAIGAALGPAAGGLLTQTLDWRAIFVVQVPIAIAAAFAVRRAEWPAAGRASVRSSISLAFVSGALVGALFLVVVLLIDVWGLRPALAAAAVAAIPAGTIGSRALARRGLGAAAGCVLLAAGLAAVALVPTSDVAWIVAALFLCGVGLGLAAGVGVDGGPGSIGWRHAGLVLGLVLVTPLLTHDLQKTPPTTERIVTARMLDARLPIDQKVSLAEDLARTFGHARELPNFDSIFAARARAGADPRELASLKSELDESIRATVTRGFRNAFLLCAVLALVAMLPLLRLRLSPRAHLRVAGAVAVIAAALLGTEVGAGGLSYGAANLQDPCKSTRPSPGDGIDGLAQRLANRGLDAAACKLDVSREQLVLDGARTADQVLSQLRRL